MECSCRIRYVILALIELAAYYASGDLLQVKEIATRQQLPCHYLEQLLAILRRASLVRSQRGMNGGYSLNRLPTEITLLDIVNCLEGEALPTLEDSPHLTTAEAKVVSEVCQETHQAAQAVLERYTLADLLQKREAQAQTKPMYYI